MPTNKAAWITEAKANPLTVKDAPYTDPEAHEMVVKNAVLGMTPVDNKVQDMDLFKMTYPTILGNEVAGEVVAVGSEVKSVNVGQRVLGNTSVLGTHDPKHGAFQLYTVLRSDLVAPIPDSMSYDAAAVLPVSLTTAAAALFVKDYLAVPLPSLSPSPTRSTLLLWGGSSSVGCSTLQFARAVGVEVITTASPHNFELCKSLGASQVFDYHSPSIVDEIASALKGKDFVGAFDTIGITDTMKTCCEIVAKNGVMKMVVSTVPPLVEFDKKGVVIKPVFSQAITKTDIVGPIWGEYVPKALAEGKLLPKPDPIVAGIGLEAIQQGLNRCKEGYSAAKIVVKL
ncbi:hypothetical protein ACLMJK_005227 [Lecanora helva]